MRHRNVEPSRRNLNCGAGNSRTLICYQDFQTTQGKLNKLVGIRVILLLFFLKKPSVFQIQEEQLLHPSEGVVKGRGTGCLPPIYIEDTEFC